MTELGHDDIHGSGSGRRGDPVITSTSIPGVDITWKQWAQGQLTRYGIAGIVAIFFGWLILSAYRDAVAYIPKTLEGFKEHNAQQRKDHLDAAERQTKAFIEATQTTDKRHLEMIQLLREGRTLSSRSVDIQAKQYEALKNRTQELERMIEAINKGNRGIDENKRDIDKLKKKQDDQEQQLSQLLMVTPFGFHSGSIGGS